MRGTDLGAVDRLGEAGEARAFAEELRAHGDDHVEVDDVRRGFAAFLGRGAVDEIDEQLRLVAARVLLVAEQLLELVDEDAEALAANGFERRGDRGKRRGAGVELAGDCADALGVAGAPLEPGEFGGEIPERPARRPHGASEPRRVVAAILERELR